MAVETVANVHAPWHADVFIRTFGDGHAAVTGNVSCVTAATLAAALSEAAAIALEATNVLG